MRLFQGKFAKAEPSEFDATSATGKDTAGHIIVGFVQTVIKILYVMLKTCDIVTGNIYF